MNKTRMGKRVASLLLSLVMMLSLLPTAAYATMADGAETQDAIVSGNGTGVSDDSEGSGVTGDQKVEGSNGSNTVGDTAGAEGGADPSDLVNGNDSADPQDDGDAVLPAAANVAKVGDTEYATLEAAIAALSSSSYTLELLDESVWEAATPVYWAAGSESGYAATLADALTAAYMANAGGITIVCRPGEDVGKLTHGHVADDITIYGNNAYISSGECDLEVDTYTFSRDTGKQVTSGGAYLEKDITITAYELDNLGVWGERHTSHKVTVDLTDCDSTDGITVQRVYISGTTGVNDITLTGCDFGTKATSVYSNADGAVVIDNCSFTGAQVPVNFNHKANGTQTVAVQNSTFTNCGDNGDWEQFAAPVRFVNSGSGTMTTTVATCTFTGTVGSNGDILLGDGREGQKSNDVALTVESTEATVQAQQPGYYGSNGTTDASKQGTKNVAAGDKLTTSVTQLMPSETTTSVAEVNGVKYDSLQAAIDAAAQNATVTLLADTRENVTIETYGLTLDLSGHTLNGGTEKGKPALTVMARVTVKDSSAAKTGTIMREDTAENSGVSSHYVIDIQDGWLFFESGSVTNNSGVVGVKGASLVRVGDDSVAKYPGLTISGGTFTQDNFIVIKVDRGTFYLKEDGTLNSKNSYAVENWKFAEIKGGTVNGTVAAWTYSGGHNSDLTISGGTVNGNVLSVNYGSAEGKVAKVSITGGTVNGALDTRSYDPSTNALTSIDDATKATIEVTGGTFSNDPTKYVVEDSGVTKNTDGTYGVAKAYLAKVGDTSYYTMDEAFKAQTTSGEAIVLLRDYTTGSTFNSGSINRTVDLDGHTWTCTGTDANSAAFEINYSDVTLTVKNGKVVSSQLVGLIPSAMGGTIKYDNSSLEFDGVVMTTTAHSGIETNGNNTNDTVTLRNSTLNVPNGFGIYFPSSGTLTIDNSKINAKTMGVQVCSGSLNISGAGAAITVSGDGIDKTINDGAIEDGAAISIVNRIGYKGLDEIKVEGGTFTANGTNAAVKAYDWDNTNKTESDFTQAAKVSVSGGTFSSEVDKSLCAKGYIPTKNADGTYGVKEGKYVAEIGSQGYESLTEAVAAAEDGQTVTLLADAAEDVVISKSITLDLGGKTLTNTNAGKATISVTGGTVTVKNGNVMGGTGYYNIEVTKEGSNANLTLTDVTATAGNTGSSMIDNYGTLTITSGTYTGGLNVVKSEEGSVLNISGGTFTLEYATNGYTGVIFAYGDTTISGGEFIQNLTTTGRWNHPQVILTGVVEGYTAITKVTGGHFVNKMSGESIFRGVGKATSDNFKVSGGTFNKSISESFCADGFIPTKNADGTYGVKEGKFVAEVGSTGYETFDEAIAAANASAKSATIHLRENITIDHQLVIENAKGKAITLNLEGFTLTSTYAINKAIKNGSYALVNNTPLTIKNGTFAAGQARAIGALAALTLNKATVTQQLTGDHACVAFCAADKSYTIKDSTIVGAYSVCNFANNATITITGSTLTGTGNTLYHNGSNYGLKLTVKDTTITSSGSCGVYISGSTSAQSNADNQNGAGGYQQAIFTGCTISGALNGVEVKYTDLTLDGCTVSTTAKDASYKQDNNGPAGSGFAVVSTDNAMNNVTPKPEGTIIIKGAGQYTGPVGLGSLKSVKETYADFADETIKISGGTFTTEVPAAYCADGFIPTQNEDGTYGVKVGKYVAEVGSTKYETLAEAVAAAQDGQTVRLLADVAESSIKVNANITIDLNKMTVTGSFVTYGEVTIQNGTIDVPDGKTNYAYGKLTLADVDITGKAASSSLLSVNYNGSVTIDKDSTIVADSEQGHFPAVFIKGQDDSGKTYAPELNIYGTVQSAKTPAIQGNGTDRGVSHVNVFEGAVVKSETLAIYLPQPCEVNITGGLVEGYCGIGIKSGTLNISGGTVRGVAKDNVIGDEYSQTNGISYDGSAIMIDSYIGYAGQVQINISGNAVVESKYSTAIREIGNDKSQTNLVGLDITGGTVLGAKDTDAVLVRDVTAKDVNISGGEFSSIVKKEYCAPGFTPVTTANSEGRYGVEVGKFTVMVTSRTTGSDSPVANVAGGGSDITYAQGTTVTASAISGYKFVGWFVNEYTGTPYSTKLTCEVKPTADWTMIAVYEPISGGKFWLNVTASEFTVNGGAVQDSYLYEQFAIGTSVTVKFTGTENFLYWVNESGKVVSTSKTYTFSMGSATTLKAVYAEKEEHQAMVVFISHTQQVISSKGYTDTQEIQFPEPPIKMGATFVRWSMTEAEIRAAMATTTTGIIVVEPVYEFSAGSYTVTVNYPNDETATYTATVGKITTVTAKSIDGKVFKCWKNGDTVLGYTETLKIAPRGDLTLTAEYVDAGTTVDRLPVIALTEISASQQGAKYAVSFTATRSVPDGYTVTEQGILVSTNSRYGQSDALDAMKLDANGAKPDDTFILKATNTDATGVTVLNGTVSAADRTVYGRAYMILRDSSGAMVYVYSDTIQSGSYNSLTTNGGN